MADDLRYLSTNSTGGDGTANSDSGATAAYASMSAAFADIEAESGHAGNVIKLYCINRAGGADTSSYVMGSAMSTQWTSIPDGIEIIGGIPPSHPSESEEEYLGTSKSSVLDTDRYYLQTNSNFDSKFYFYNNTCDLRFKHLQVDVASTNTNINCIQAGLSATDRGAITIIVDGCIITQSGTGATGISGILPNVGSNASAKCVIINNVVEGMTQGISDNQYQPNGDWQIANNTVDGVLGNGFQIATNPSGTCKVQNNISVDCTTDYSLANVDTQNTNLSSDGSASTTNDPPTFANQAGKDYAPANGTDSMVGFGTDLSADSVYAFDWDLFDVTRSDWSAGAVEYVPAISANDDFYVRTKRRNFFEIKRVS